MENSNGVSSTMTHSSSSFFISKWKLMFLFYIIAMLSLSSCQQNSDDKLKMKTEDCLQND